MKTILVRAPNWIGDQILAYPFFHFLRKAYPDARIVSACVPWVRPVQFRHLVDEVVTLPVPAVPGFVAKFEASEAGAKELRKLGRWDLGISLPNSLSSAWILLRAGAKARRGYAVDGRGLLLNERLSWDPEARVHRAQAYANLLPEGARPRRDVLEFWGVPPENDLDPGIPGELSGFDLERAWPDDKRERVDPPPEPYWVLAPGSTASSRRWPAENFAALARRVVAETGLPGLVIGGAAEAPIAAELCEDRSLKLRDWTAMGQIPCYGRVFANARFCVTNDSGLAHVAALCGSRVQVVWGAGDPNHTAPIGPGKVQVLFNPVDCWPCERNTCQRVDPGEPKLECIAGIQPESVWKELRRVL